MPKKKNRYDYALRRKRVLEFTRSLKDKPCMDCRGIFPPIVMQFDHRDPATKQISKGHGMSGLKTITSVRREAEKCDIVCANCHMIRTEKRRLFSYRSNNPSDKQIPLF